MIDKKANSSLKDDQEIHVDEIEDQISVEEALQMLKNDNSDGGLEKSLKLFLLENLPNDTTHVKDQSVFSQQSEDIGLKFEDVEEDENRIGKTGVIEAEQLNLKDSEENKKSGVSLALENPETKLFSKKRVVPLGFTKKKN